MPEIKELRKQMFDLLATPRQRAYIESRRRAHIDQISMLEENAAIRKETVAIRKENETIKRETAAIRKENETIKRETVAIRKENETIKRETAAIRKENAALTNRVETLERERQEQNEKEINRKELFCQRLVKTAVKQFNRPVSEIRTLLEGQTQEILDEAFELLLSNVNYEEFVKSVSKVQ